MEKVCHITSVHSSDDARVFHKQCVSLAEAGYEVYLVAPGESREDKGVHVIGIGEKPRDTWKRLFFSDISGRAERTARELDCAVYHIHDPELMPAGVRLARQGKKVIFDSHEDIPGQILEKKWLPGRKLVSRLFALYQGWALRRYSAVISVTPHICDMLRRANPRTVMITNYPRLEPLPPLPEGGATLSLCCAGGVRDEWSHRQILEAIQDIPGVTYELYGPEPVPGYAESLRQGSGGDKLRYHGKIAHSEVGKAIRGSRISMALCQYSENSGGKIGTLGNNKMFESMMSALPLICTDYMLWEEIVSRYQCGICVPPQDVEAIRKAVLTLLDDESLAVTMGQNGRRAVEEEYNWKAQEKTLLALYDELIKEAKTK